MSQTLAHNLLTNHGIAVPGLANGSSSPTRLVELIQVQSARASANLRVVATTRGIALSSLGGLAARRERVPTVTLAEVLDAEVGIPLADGSAQLDGQRLVDGGEAGERAVVRVIGVASLGGIGRGRGRRGVFLVDVEAIAPSAGFGRVAGAGEAAVARWGGVASGLEDVAAVAFAAVLDAELGVVLADCGASLHG